MTWIFMWSLWWFYASFVLVSKFLLHLGKDSEWNNVILHMNVPMVFDFRNQDMAKLYGGEFNLSFYWHNVASVFAWGITSWMLQMVYHLSRPRWDCWCDKSLNFTNLKFERWEQHWASFELASALLTSTYLFGWLGYIASWSARRHSHRQCVWDGRSGFTN